MDKNAFYLHSRNSSDYYFSGSACLYLPRKTIADMLKPQTFRGQNVWCLYPTTVYDRIEADAFHDFVIRFFYCKRNKKFESCYYDGLCCILFRPHLMTPEDFDIIRKALDYFEENSICFGYGRLSLP